MKYNYFYVLQQHYNYPTWGWCDILKANTKKLLEKRITKYKKKYALGLHRIIKRRELAK